MNEEWRDIKYYEGQYQVSDLGNVRSIGRTVKYKDGRTPKYFNGQQLKLRNVRGYKQVILNKDGNKSYRYVHRLVYEAFIEAIPSDREINHIDGNKANNIPLNLELVTHAENLIHASQVLNRWDDVDQEGEHNGNSKLSEDDVVTIRTAYASGRVNQLELADKYEVTQRHISKIVTGILWPNAEGPITRVGRGKPKLSDDQVLAIRGAYFGGFASIKSIRAEYNLGASTVKRILNGAVYQLSVALSVHRRYSLKRNQPGRGELPGWCGEREKEHPKGGWNPLIGGVNEWITEVELFLELLAVRTRVRGRTIHTHGRNILHQCADVSFNCIHLNHAISIGDILGWSVAVIEGNGALISFLPTSPERALLA